MKILLITSEEGKEAWRDLPRFCKAHGIEYRELRNAQQRLGKKRFPFEFGKYKIEKIEASNEWFTNIRSQLIPFEPRI